MTVDFTGWKYFELVEIESTRYSDYIWEMPVETREIPDIKSGNNKITFSCDGSENISSRVEVTVINEGDPL